MHLSSLTAYQFQEGIGDEPKRDPFRDAKCERHHQQRQECGDGRCDIVPINVDDVFEHQTSNDNQRRGNDGIKQRIFADRVSCPDHLNQRAEE